MPLKHSLFMAKINQRQRRFRGWTLDAAKMEAKRPKDCLRGKVINICQPGSGPARRRGLGGGWEVCRGGWERGWRMVLVAGARFKK